MELSPRTKIYDLMTTYPFLIDYFIELSPHFQNLKNPEMFNIMAKVADIEKAAGAGGLDLKELMAGIVARVKEKTGDELMVSGIDLAGVRPAGSQVPDRQEALKQIIRDLHAGVDMEVLKARFRELIQGVEATEIAAMEQALMDEGLPAEEIKRLCDVHVEIFKDALQARDLPSVPPGHPVHTFMKENRASEKIMSALSILMGKLGRPPTPEAFERHREGLGNLMQRLAKIDIHYARKENQLFPLLEAHHFSGPTQVMWALHDDIRALLKKARQEFERSNPTGTVNALQEAIATIREMIYKEEHILYPTSLDMISESEWIRMKEGERDIGYAWVEPDQGWPDVAAAAAEPAPQAPPAPEGALSLDTGALSPELVNLLLKHLPLDITFVDENDRVLYFSDTPERIFPRSPGIIGREVRNCHPPKSVHLVNKILDAFKSGARDSAQFWIQVEGKFILIRYFAVRDADNNYRGCLEVSQEVSDIRRLEGERRLLEWD